MTDPLEDPEPKGSAAGCLGCMLALVSALVMIPILFGMCTRAYEWAAGR